MGAERLKWDGCYSGEEYLLGVEPSRMARGAQRRFVFLLEEVRAIGKEW